MQLQIGEKKKALQKGETLAIKHHQLKLNAKTANQIATLLQQNGITTLQWAACGGGDNNINEYIQVFTNKGITVVAVKDGQSAIIAKDENGDEYFVGVNESGHLVLPEDHKSSDDDQIDTEDTEDTEEHAASGFNQIVPTKNVKFLYTLDQDKVKNASGNVDKRSLSDYVKTHHNSLYIDTEETSQQIARLANLIDSHNSFFGYLWSFINTEGIELANDIKKNLHKIETDDVANLLAAMSADNAANMLAEISADNVVNILAAMTKDDHQTY